MCRLFLVIVTQSYLHGWRALGAFDRMWILHRIWPSLFYSLISGQKGDVSKKWKYNKNWCEPLIQKWTTMFGWFPRDYQEASIGEPHMLLFVFFSFSFSPSSSVSVSPRLHLMTTVMGPSGRALIMFRASNRVMSCRLTPWTCRSSSPHCRPLFSATPPDTQKESFLASFTLLR